MSNFNIISQIVIGTIILASSQVFAQTGNQLLDAAQGNQTNPPASTSGSQTTFTPFYVKGDSLKPFEKVGAKMEAKSIGMGYGGVNTYYTIFDKPLSPVRFHHDSIPQFIITVDPGTDVFEMILIVKADVVKNKTYRRFVSSGVSMAGSKDMSAYQVKPELKLVGADKYLIILPKLAAGEYAFMPIYKGAQASSITTPSGNYRIYCFGIK